MERDAKRAKQNAKDLTWRSSTRCKTRPNRVIKNADARTPKSRESTLARTPRSIESLSRLWGPRRGDSTLSLETISRENFYARRSRQVFPPKHAKIVYPRGSSPSLCQNSLAEFRALSTAGIDSSRFDRKLCRRFSSKIRTYRIVQIANSREQRSNQGSPQRFLEPRLAL